MTEAFRHPVSGGFKSDNDAHRRNQQAVEDAINGLGDSSAAAYSTLLSLDMTIPSGDEDTVVFYHDAGYQDELGITNYGTGVSTVKRAGWYRLTLTCTSEDHIDRDSLVRLYTGYFPMDSRRRHYTTQPTLILKDETFDFKIYSGSGGSPVFGGIVCTIELLKPVGASPG